MTRAFSLHRAERRAGDLLVHAVTLAALSRGRVRHLPMHTATTPARVLRTTLGRRGR